MKILQICAIGITVKDLLLPQIDYLISQGLSVEIACSLDKEARELQQKGYIIHPIEIDRRIDFVSNLNCVYNLTKFIKNNQYDVVHVHTPIAAFLGRIAAKLAGVKKIIYTSHGFYFHDLTPPLQYTLFYSLEKIAAYITDLIFSVNYEDIKLIKNTKLYPLEKVHYLGSIGVNLEQFNPINFIFQQQQTLKQSLFISEKSYPIIGTIGRLNHKKGSLYLIDAIAQLRSIFPSIHGLIVGEEISTDPDKCQEETINKIQELNLKNSITLTGYQENIPSLLSLMDIFTLPTFAHEGLPTVIIEAMAMEKPVIATNIRGCREAILNEETGLIVPPQDVQALAQAIETLAKNPQKCREMGQAGRKRVQEEYDINLVLQRLANGYQNLGIL